MGDEIKISMIAAANAVLEYRKKKPNADADEIMPHILKLIKEKGDAKIAAVAAANRALYYKDRTSLGDKAIIQNIMNESSEMLKNLQPEI